MYDVLIIDPPWQKKKGGLRKSRPNQGRELDYATMATEAIFDLLDKEVFILAEEHHVVFMWTIEQFLTECDVEMLKRGYKRHIRIVWNKTNGIAPAFTIRYAHEYLVWYYKPKLLKIADTQRGKHISVITEKARQHSRKPDAAYVMVNNLYPDSKKIDVFSREKRPGFSQWGDQIKFFHSG
jgi:N6-adenosine-specific RNA methylase IME4